MANSITYRGDFKLGDDYHTMDVVTFGGREYFCVQANNFQEPGSVEYWALIGRGQSAYEIALKYGFQGSEQDFAEKLVGGKPKFELKDGHIYADDTDLGAFTGAVPVVKSIAVLDGQALDNLTTEGKYYASGVKALGVPSQVTHDWVMEVIGQGSAIIQRLTEITTTDQYVRSYDGTKWSDWIITTSWGDQS